MRTDEDVLTGLALGAVPCPCEEDCDTARRAASDDFGTYHRDGIGRVVSSHQTMDELVTCVTAFFARFMESWANYKMAELILRHNDLANKFMKFLAECRSGKTEEVQALRRVIRRLRLYTCTSKDELKNFAVHKLMFIAAEAFAETYPKYK